MREHGSCMNLHFCFGADWHHRGILRGAVDPSRMQSPARPFELWLGAEKKALKLWLLAPASWLKYVSHCS